MSNTYWNDCHSCQALRTNHHASARWLIYHFYMHAHRHTTDTDIGKVRGHRKSSQKPSEMNKVLFCGGGGGGRKNHTLVLKWSFINTLVWDLKPEVRTFVLFGGREGLEWNQFCLFRLVSVNGCDGPQQEKERTICPHAYSHTYLHVYILTYTRG